MAVLCHPDRKCPECDATRTNRAESVKEHVADEEAQRLAQLPALSPDALRVAIGKDLDELLALHPNTRAFIWTRERIHNRLDDLAALASLASSSSDEITSELVQVLRDMREELGTDSRLLSKLEAKALDAAITALSSGSRSSNEKPKEGTVEECAAGCGRSVWVDLNPEGRLSVRGVKLTEAESQTARTLFYELHERQADPYALDRVIEVILASRIPVRASAIEVIDGDSAPLEPTP
jgi:hypothetical protein